MKIKHGVTAILFDEKEGKLQLLIMHRVLNWSGWEFVKGGIDAGENPEEAVLREIEEETGLRKVSIHTRLQSRISWASNGTEYHYVPFLIKADMSEPLDLEQEIIEHDGYKWVSKDEVEKFLTHNDNKKIFKEALGVLGQ